MLHIVEIILDFAPDVLHGVAIARMNLRPSGHARTDSTSGAEEGDLALQQMLEFRSLGARTDQGHITHRDVPELGEFVEVRPSQQATDAGNTRVIAGSPPCP